MSDKCLNYRVYGFDCFADENVTKDAKFVHPVCLECKNQEPDWKALSEISEDELFERWWGLERASYGKDYKEVGREAFDTARKPLKAGIRSAIESIGKNSHIHRCRGLKCSDVCDTKKILDSILKEVKS